MYDLYVMGPLPMGHPVRATDVTSGFVGEAVDLTAARLLFSRYRDSGVATLIVPVAYRDMPQISATQALAVAREEHQRRKRSSADALGELSPGSEEPMWWAFCASNLTAQRDGLIPGVSNIHVDKLSGRLLSWEDCRSLLGLSFP